jgi:hypothetical protein
MPGHNHPIHGRVRKPAAERDGKSGTRLFSLQDFVVFGMLSDPKPVMDAVLDMANCPKIIGDANRPENPDFFKLE